MLSFKIGMQVVKCYGYKQNRDSKAVFVWLKKEQTFKLKVHCTTAKWGVIVPLK